jgi:hypothetical protein
MEKIVTLPSALVPRHTFSEDVVGFGNVLIEPSSGPAAGLTLHLQFAMPSEPLSREQLLELRQLIDAQLAKQ